VKQPTPREGRGIGMFTFIVFLAFLVFGIAADQSLWMIIGNALGIFGAAVSVRHCHALVKAEERRDA
jgi:hypothetical protein